MLGIMIHDFFVILLSIVEEILKDCQKFINVERNILDKGSTVDYKISSFKVMHAVL